jgi:hypothetical protein
MKKLQNPLTPEVLRFKQTVEEDPVHRMHFCNALKSIPRGGILY